MLVERLPKLDELVNVLVGRMMWCVHTNIVLPMGGWRNLRAALTVYLKSSYYQYRWKVSSVGFHNLLWWNLGNFSFYVLAKIIISF